jgi:DNA-binding transcriptional MerR regulator
MLAQEAHHAHDFSVIGEVCEELGVSLRTLRFYEAKGLVAPRRDKGHRFYNGADIERLRLVLQLKALGLSLAEIKQTIHKPTDGPYGLNRELCEQLIERLSYQKASTDAALNRLQQVVLQFRTR